MRTDLSFNLKPPRALYLVLRESLVNSPEGQKSPMNQLELQSSTTYRAAIFTRSVSHQEHSSLKISAQKDHSKWEIFCEGGGALIDYRPIKLEKVNLSPFFTDMSKRAEILNLEVFRRGLSSESQ